MLIANPIYDVVFRYLMNNKKVARLMVSAILGEIVEDLEFRATEIKAEMPQLPLTVLRLDFTARIRVSGGESKRVLIEIQKTYDVNDIVRFRRYVGLQYTNEDNVVMADGVVMGALPIITVYFLGSRLKGLDAPVIRVRRQYLDAALDEVIPERHEFIESLTHDSVIIQIPNLKAHRRNQLEEILTVFDQSRKTMDAHVLAINEDELLPEYQDVLRELVRAAADEKVRTVMDLEDDVLRSLKSHERRNARLEQLVEEHLKRIEEKDKTIEEKDRAIHEKDQLIAELMKKLPPA